MCIADGIYGGELLGMVSAVRQNGTGKFRSSFAEVLSMCCFNCFCMRINTVLLLKAFAT